MGLHSSIHHTAGLSDIKYITIARSFAACVTNQLITVLIFDSSQSACVLELHGIQSEDYTKHNVLCLKKHISYAICTGLT